MAIKCSDKNCVLAFDGVEELKSHERAVHSSTKDGLLPEIPNSDPSPNTTITLATIADLASKSSIEGCPVQVESSSDSQQLKQLLPSASKHSYTSTQPPSAPIDCPHLVVDEPLHTEEKKSVDHVKEVARQEVVKNCYRYAIPRTIPRKFDRRTTLTIRNLEDGLKDTSLADLLGHYSSDEESDDGFSNYSYL
ncbi:uncharacterized protein RAG0_02060 [Rhynchosporium agropyri]|uniref:C2H2-type domain-containing protein n=1 Tax=Rhynchosporium agropyri TaxID=914238 RepID=A0A1E1K043_9HELO|nr:uncharacterized protein RAG0_02060 [Rhynchosporium agropyri]